MNTRSAADAITPKRFLALTIPASRKKDSGISARNRDAFDLLEPLAAPIPASDEVYEDGGGI